MNRYKLFAGAILLVAAVALGLPRLGIGQRSVETDALRWAGPFNHGPALLPAEIRARVSGDADMVRLYADLLEGRRQTEHPWNRTSALFWIAESGDPQYVPLLLKYASADSAAQPLSMDRFDYAVYGLARSAERDEARTRLLELGRPGRADHRALLAQVLGEVNDPAARRVLEALPRDRMAPAARAALERALGRPARGEGEGRWPCVPQGVAFPDNDKLIHCTAR